jgi:hypothetical protein
MNDVLAEYVKTEFFDELSKPFSEQWQGWIG